MIQAICIKNTCSCGCGQTIPCEVGLVYEIQVDPDDSDYVFVKGVTPFNDGTAIFESVRSYCFAPFSEKDECDFQHAEAIVSTMELLNT